MNVKKKIRGKKIREYKAYIKFCRKSAALSRLNFNQNITTDFNYAKIIYPTFNY